MAGELARALNAQSLDIEHARLSPERLASLIGLVDAGTVNLNTAKRVFQQAFASGDDPGAIVEREGLAQVSDSGAIDAAVEEVLSAKAAEVERFRNGEEKVFGFLVGQVMRALRGKGNPAVVNEVLRRKLGG
jgi:aspartyl-tRNA(Asn)/glutamyl-tRNA(Gln) amidotransferase subunit B